jgi:peptide methionine sulfoxide reductase MsrA
VNKIIFLVSILCLSACSSTSYKFNDFAHACVNKQDKELAKNISSECLPVDTYEDSIHYHQTYQNEYRKMPDLDAAMDNRP